MTTIAFDGKILAADKGGDVGDLKIEVKKLFDVTLCDEARDRLGLSTNHIWYAATGYLNRTPLILKWMSLGGELPKYPDENTVIGLLVEVETALCYMLEDILTTIPVNSLPVTAGSGHEMALGAMLAGANAIQAIEITASRSRMAWGGVDSFALSDEVIAGRDNMNYVNVPQGVYYPIDPNLHKKRSTSCINCAVVMTYYIPLTKDITCPKCGETLKRWDNINDNS